MNFNNLKEIIEFAIEREKEAVSFYEDASARQEYSDARKMFKDFANEERKHRALLEGFLKGEKTIVDYQFKWIPDMKRSNYIVDLQYEKGMPYSDILRLAMKREEKAFKFYTDFSERTETREHKKLFQILAQEEAKHKLKLETLLDDFMARMGD